MERSIEDLLHRRTDLSTFLVHLTKDIAGATARDTLLRIVGERTLKAGQPQGLVRAWLDRRTTPPIVRDRSELLASQYAVCFSETPLEHTWMMCEDIAGRGVKLASYGVAITKAAGRRRDVNPVWYIDQTTGREWLLHHIWELMDEAYVPSKPGSRGRDHPIFRLTPFFDTMSPGWDGVTRKEFWWEREWRHIGDFKLKPAEVVAFFAPETDHDAVRETAKAFAATRSIPVLDPRWGLEQMVMTLSGVRSD